MNLQPVSTRTDRRRGGTGSALLLMLPVGALMVTVSIAWIGRPGEPAPAVPSSPAGPVARSAAPAATPVAASASPVATAAPDARPSSPPTTAFRIPVRSVADAVAARHAGEIRGGLVAVTGHFTLDPRRSACVDGPSSTAADFCRRTGLLSGSPSAVLAVDRDDVEAQVVQLDSAAPLIGTVTLPGIPLPTELTDAAAGTGPIAPMRVVAIGRFVDRRAPFCPHDGRRCGGDFVVERVAWVAGTWSDGLIARSTSVPGQADSAERRSARVIASREADRGEVILSRALLTFDVLTAVDPAAASAVRPPLRPNGGDPIWYVRSVARPDVPGGTRPVAWAVIDQRTGLLLASATEPVE